MTPDRRIAATRRAIADLATRGMDALSPNDQRLARLDPRGPDVTIAYWLRQMTYRLHRMELDRAAQARRETR